MKIETWLIRLLFAFLLVLTDPLLALPSGAEVIQGQAVLSFSPNSLQVHANGKAILNWDQFNIASHEAVHFVQLQETQAILNRVTSGSASEILGSLQANCPIYLVNPNGVFIGSSACIETAGFLASTADLSNEAFLQGTELLFQEFGSGRIVNLGKIHASHGDVFLIARAGIDNQGIVEAPNGIAMLTTRELMLYPDTKECVFIRVSDAAEDRIQNSGNIRALSVELNTASLYERAIQHTGSIEAFMPVEQNGKIYLVAERGETIVNGSIFSEAGEIRVLGQTVVLEEETGIDVSGKEGGIVLIGGDYKGSTLSVQNAQNTRVAKGAQIKADGWKGNAGKIVVWSDVNTECDAKMSASAFGDVGHGGFVEISGKKTLTTSSVPNLRSKAGKAGTLLLDPGAVTITSGTASGPDTFGSTFINTTLASGNLTISTVNAKFFNSSNSFSFLVVPMCRIIFWRVFPDSRKL